MNVLTIGTICFGLFVGYVTYRTLARTTANAAISDLNAILGAVGGAAVTSIVQPGTNLFGWYAIALVIGFAAYALIYLKVNGRDEFAKVMGSSERSR